MHGETGKIGRTRARTATTGGDLLRDKIYELRASLQGIHYRILYFFHGNTAAVLSHGIVKEKAVPTKEIEKAIERKRKFEANPAKHTHEN